MKYYAAALKIRWISAQTQLYLQDIMLSKKSKSQRETDNVMPAIYVYVDA